MVPKVSTLSAKLPGNISPKYLGITLLAVCALATGVGLFFAGRKLLVNRHAVALKKLKLEVSASIATKNFKFSEFDYDGIVRKYTTSEIGALSEREAKEAILSTVLSQHEQFYRNMDDEDINKFMKATTEFDNKFFLLLELKVIDVESELKVSSMTHEDVLKVLNGILNYFAHKVKSSDIQRFAAVLVKRYFKLYPDESIQKFQNSLKRSLLVGKIHKSNILISVLCQIDRFQAFYEGLSDDEKGKCIQAAYEEIHSEIINATRGPTRVDVVKRIKNKP
ncbi:MAG: hypothetical protein H7A39_04190 [Chlamydiales bacterium]|nr:hypothetical protein [Chlamydiales bacterium]